MAVGEREEGGVEGGRVRFKRESWGREERIIYRRNIVCCLFGDMAGSVTRERTSLPQNNCVQHEITFLSFLPLYNPQIAIPSHSCCAVFVYCPPNWYLFLRRVWHRSRTEGHEHAGMVLKFVIFLTS